MQNPGATGNSIQETAAGWLAPVGGTLGAVAHSVQTTLAEEFQFGLRCLVGALIGLFVRQAVSWVSGRFRKKCGCPPPVPPPEPPKPASPPRKAEGETPPPNRNYYDD